MVGSRVVDRIEGRHQRQNNAGHTSYVCEVVEAKDLAEAAASIPALGMAPAAERAVDDRITLDPQIMSGVPVFRGTRIPVYIVLDYLADGYTIEQLLEDYPNLSRDDIRAALLWASRLLSSPSNRTTPR